MKSVSSPKPEKDLTSDETIRQKLIRQGASGLTDAELLSIILRDGGKELSAIGLSEALLDHYNGNLTELGLEKINKLRMFRGMGIGKAAVVAAAMELGKRRKVEESVNIRAISGKEDVVALFKPLISELPHEEFWALYLGASNRILDKVKISQGSSTATIVDNRLIVKRALDKFATSIIIVHNHPSGQPKPSTQDEEITAKLKAAAALFDIRLTDHIIVTAGESFSFLGNGIL
ncbi:DNA repair protein RadC [Alistipes sp. OttesenSCG-928-L06]|nr:DNA repair protein RadC [Alistipes sp. OttesenSCG-928-L06]